VPGIYCSTGHLLQCRTFTAVPDIYYSAGHLLQCRAFTAVPGIYCSAGHLLQCRAFTAVMDIYCSAGHLLQCPSSNRYAKCLVIGNHHWKSTSDMTLLFASELFLLRMTVALSNLPAVQAPTFLLHSICLSVCLKWRLISTFFENVNALSLSLSLSFFGVSRLCKQLVSHNCITKIFTLVTSCVVPVFLTLSASPVGYTGFESNTI